MSDDNDLLNLSPGLDPKKLTIDWSLVDNGDQLSDEMKAEVEQQLRATHMGMTSGRFPEGVEPPRAFDPFEELTRLVDKHVLDKVPMKKIENEATNVWRAFMAIVKMNLGEDQGFDEDDLAAFQRIKSTDLFTPEQSAKRFYVAMLAAEENGTHRERELAALTMEHFILLVKSAGWDFNADEEFVRKPRKSDA